MKPAPKFDEAVRRNHIWILQTFKPGSDEVLLETTHKVRGPGPGSLLDEINAAENVNRHWRVFHVPTEKEVRP